MRFLSLFLKRGRFFIRHLDYISGESGQSLRASCALKEMQRLLHQLLRCHDNATVERNTKCKEQKNKGTERKKKGKTTLPK